MAFCTNCGAPLREGQKFCTGCGAPASVVQPEAAPAETLPSPQEFSPQPPAAPSLDDRIGQLSNTPDATAAFSGEDVARNKGMSVLAYLGLLVLIPLFAAKESPFARYHVNQGLVLLVCEAAVWILGRIFSFLGTIGGILTFILAIIGIINALSGRARELPVVGKVRLLK